MSPPAYDRLHDNSMCPHQHPRDDSSLTDRLSTHVGDESRLLDRARRASTPSELVVAPVQLHQRNLQRRLREAARPQGGFAFTDPESIGRSVAREAGGTTRSLDRIDRLALLGSRSPSESPASPDDSGPSSGDADARPTFRERLGTGGDTGARHVEQVRSTIESMTNFHPDRIGALRAAARDRRPPVDADAAALVDAAVDAERALRDRARGAVSRVDVLRRATRDVDRTGGAAWTAAYPDIERVSIVGVSTLSAPYVDLVCAVLATTTVDVELHLRPGTGPFLDERLPALLAVDGPGREVFA